MPEFFNDYFLSLLNEIANPQKRVFVGYLLSAVAIAFLWLCVVEKLSSKTAVKKIFDKRIWFSRSSIADFKIILINRVIMSAGAATIVSQLTISTILYNLLHEQTLIQPLAFHAMSAGMVAILFTAFFFIFDDFSRFFVHRLMHENKFLWRFHKLHHSAKVMTPLTVFRTHPIEAILFVIRNGLVQAFVIGVSYGFWGNKFTILSYFGCNVFVMIFNVMGSNLRHSHVHLSYGHWLEGIFISPYQHQLHHSIAAEDENCNFGVVLALWDRLGGSLVRGRPVVKLYYGLGGEQHRVNDTKSGRLKLIKQIYQKRA
mgnify:CR=1 FL=1